MIESGGKGVHSYNVNW